MYGKFLLGHYEPINDPINDPIKLDQASLYFDSGKSGKNEVNPGVLASKSKLVNT
jgi:hypothetical protein